MAERYDNPWDPTQDIMAKSRTQMYYPDRHFFPRFGLIGLEAANGRNLTVACDPDWLDAVIDAPREVTDGLTVPWSVVAPAIWLGLPDDWDDDQIDEVDAAWKFLRDECGGDFAVFRESGMALIDADGEVA